MNPPRLLRRNLLAGGRRMLRAFTRARRPAGLTLLTGMMLALQPTDSATAGPTAERTNSRPGAKLDAATTAAAAASRPASWRSGTRSIGERRRLSPATSRSNPAPAAPQVAPFDRVDAGPVTSDSGQSIAPTWVDYDDDGDLDLFVTNLRGVPNALYRNDGDAGWVRANSTLVGLAGESTGAGWGDFDADGRPDVFVNDYFFGTRVYRNLGGGNFADPLELIAPDGLSHNMCGGWADYDRDGRLDLLSTRGGGMSDPPEILWRQTDEGTFEAETLGPAVGSGGFSNGGGWGDFDDDGWPDLYVGNGWDQQGFLFRNLGNRQFELVTTPPFNTQPPSADSPAWGDYDNDGDLDLFVAHGGNLVSALYRNDGAAGFTRILDVLPAQNGSLGVGAMWGDYDNDGWLDLYVANRDQANLLYRNLGDGTFDAVTEGPAVTDVKASNGCAWGDYDGDGFLDLVVANWDGQSNDLYRNQGNANGWLKVRCLGNLSNRSGIGAKVRVEALIGGTLVRQMREITSGDGWGGPELIAHFGLGDATTVDRVVVEWPSGITQTVVQPDLRQILVVSEPTGEIEVLGAPILNRQTGLFEQRVRFTRLGGSADDAVRITLADLPTGVRCTQATDDDESEPWVLLTSPPARGESIDLAFTFHQPSRRGFDSPTYETHYGPWMAPAAPTGDRFAASRTVQLADRNAVLVEFATRPGTAYAVEYSDQPDHWSTAAGTIVATANRVQWIDAGPPSTATPPGSTRTYRVVRILVP